MKYKSVDELNTFMFNDSQILSMELTGEEDGRTLKMELGGVVVRDGNSQNEFYADKYADVITLRFKEAQIQAILIEGAKYYDADGNLLEQVPDKELDVAEYDKIMKSFKDCIVFYGGQPKEKVVENFKSELSSKDMEKNCFQMIIDKEDEDGDVTSYVLSLFYDKAIAEWEHFQNKFFS